MIRPPPHARGRAFGGSTSCSLVQPLAPSAAAPGSRDSRQAPDHARPVLHDHRADHPRDDRANSRRHAPARRPATRRPTKESADPGLRVPAGRVGAGHERIRRLLRPGEPDLARAGRGQADRRLRAAAPEGLRRLARRRVHRDRDGAHRPAWARSRPRARPFDAAFREPVRFLAMRKTRDPDLLLGMLDRDADLRLVRTADKSVHYVLAENLKNFRQNSPGHRRAAGVGRRPARRAHRAAGARGGILQADGREPGRAGQHLPDRRPVGHRRSDPGPDDPVRSGSSSTVRSTR